MLDAQPSSHARAVALLLAASFGLFVAGCGSDDPLAQARSLQLEGDYPGSLELARAALDRHPDDPEAQYRYGAALGRSGEMSLAQFALRKAMESPEWKVQAGLELTSLELLTDNPEGGVAVISQVLEVEPDHIDALLLRSRAWALSRRHYQESLADADRVLELDPGNLEGLSLRAVSLLGLSRVDDAEAVIAQLDAGVRDTESEQYIGGICAMRARFAREKGELEKAEQLFGECVDAHPNDPDVMKEALDFYDFRKQPERGIEVLRKALADAPMSNQVRRMLAERLRGAGKVAEAGQVLREGTQLENPAAAQAAWVDLADHFHALEDHAAAAEALAQAVKLAGDRADPQLLFDYADALVIAGRFDEARGVAARLTVPAQRELVLGRIALEEGKPAEALRHFNAGLRLWPDNAVGRYYAAIAAEALGDYDRAISEYRYSIRAGESETDARLRLARLHEASGESALALAAAQHDYDRSPAGLEAELLAVRAAARSGNAQALRNLLARYQDRPAERAQAAANAALGVRDRHGRPKLAAEGLEKGKLLDLTDPRDAAALRTLVDLLVEAGDSAQAQARARAAVAKHPEAAVFHEIQGAALEAAGASPDAVRAAYARAVELDPARSARAYAGLARLAAAAGDVPAAIEDYRLAADADRADTGALRAAADLLVAQGRRDEAEARLAEALARDPYDGASASRLATLLLERGGDLDRALALATAAARFERGPDAEALLARVYERRGEPMPVKRAAAPARKPAGAAADPAAPQP